MALIYAATGERWNGERIDGVLHPLDIEQLWTAEELAVIGLMVEPVPEPPPPSPPPVPTSISDRQFFQQLAALGIITRDEALAAVKVGTIPPALAAFVAAIPDEDARFAAEMLLSGATVFERGHPLTAAIGAGNGWTESQVDDFFRAAAAL